MRWQHFPDGSWMSIYWDVAFIDGVWRLSFVYDKRWEPMPYPSAEAAMAEAEWRSRRGD